MPKSSKHFSRARRPLFLEQPVPKHVLKGKSEDEIDLIHRLYGLWGALDYLVKRKPASKASDKADLATVRIVSALHKCNASFRLRHGKPLIRAKNKRGQWFYAYKRLTGSPIGAREHFARSRGALVRDLRARRPQLTLFTLRHETIVAESLDAAQVWKSLDRCSLRLRSLLEEVRARFAGGMWSLEIDRGLRTVHNHTAGVVAVHAHILVEHSKVLGRRTPIGLLQQLWRASRASGEEIKVQPRLFNQADEDIENGVWYCGGFRGAKIRSPKLVDGFYLPRDPRGSYYDDQERAEWQRRAPTRPDQLFMMLAGLAWAKGGRKLSDRFGSWRARRSSPDK